jgi:hypothetical protein
MANYIIAYHGGSKPESPEAGAAHMAKWRDWLTELADAVVNPGTPLGNSRIVSAEGVSDDGGSNAMSGFSVVEADSLDAAIAMAQACPFLETGGTLEVAEMKSMPGS